jgi:hypothetical protein
MPHTSDTNGESDKEEGREQPQKRLKITAQNGYLGHMKFHSLKLAAVNARSNTPKRAHSKAKLGLLPSLPLDVLFEVFFSLWWIAFQMLTCGPLPRRGCRFSVTCFPSTCCI